MKKILISVFVLIIILASFLWQGTYSPKNSLLTERELFFVEKGHSLFEVAQNLEDQGLIKSRKFFQTYVISKGFSKRLKSGIYSLSPSMNIPEIARKITLGDVAKIKITIPEGFTLKQIEERFSEVRMSIALDALKVGDFKDEFEFFKDVPAETSLEGFLFPDTYQFSYIMSEKQIVKQMLKNFDRKLTPDLRKAVQKQEKSVFEIVIMASLLEKEVKSFEDKKLVSGVLWKRLKSNIPLQVDCTIAYITGERTTKISKQALQIDSPYNTYKYRGLPIGPVCNPGQESIKAALYPKASQYFYYLSASPQGNTVFSKTLEEHNIAKARYLK